MGWHFACILPALVWLREIVQRAKKEREAARRQSETYAISRLARDRPWSVIGIEN